MRVFRIGAEFSAGGCGALARSDDIARGVIIFHPVDDRAQQVKRIVCIGTASAMAHAGYVVITAGIAPGFIGLGRPLIKPECVVGREPSVADAVIEQDLPSSIKEGRKVRPVITVRAPLHRIIAPLCIFGVELTSAMTGM